MRPLHRAGVDKERYVLLLTPARLLSRVSEVTVAPISTARGHMYRTQFNVGAAEGIDHDSVVKCESIVTIRRDRLGDQVGFLPEWREPELRDAIVDAFGLIPILD